MRRTLALLATLAVAAAAHANHGEDAARPHHTDQGFRNPNGAETAKSFGAVLGWKLESLRAGLPPDPREPTPVVAPEVQQLRANTDPVRRVGTNVAPPLPSATRGSATPRCWCKAVA